MFSSVIETNGMSVTSALICTAVSLGMGLLVALTYLSQGRTTKSFFVSLIILPAIVQAVIMMVNGNIGTGVAVVGAFSLIRFRSVAGGAKDICTIFLAMAIGLATGMGYIYFAMAFTAVVCVVLFLAYRIKFGERESKEKHLKIVIPEDLDYSEVFTDIFQKFAKSSKLVKVKTTNLGSMYELTYEIELKKGASEKELIDEIRCRNGNLTIVCSQAQFATDEL